jgi:hypothetical protein
MWQKSEALAADKTAGSSPAFSGLGMTRFGVAVIERLNA